MITLPYPDSDSDTDFALRDSSPIASPTVAPRAVVVDPLDPQRILEEAVARPLDPRTPQGLDLGAYCAAGDVGQVAAVVMGKSPHTNVTTRVPGNSSMCCRLVDAVAVYAARCECPRTQARYRAICLLLLGGDPVLTHISYQFATAYGLLEWYRPFIVSRNPDVARAGGFGGAYEVAAPVVPWPIGNGSARSS